MSAHHQHQPGAVTANTDRRWLIGALAVILAFMLGEVAVGLAADSLALLSDAAHMLTDAASIMLALWAIRLAGRPASGRMTYGWKRAEILSAQANGVTLLALATWLSYEAIQRLIDPPAVAGTLVLGTALVGIAVNVAATWMMSKANRTSLNIEGAFQHVLNDLYAFIATAAAGLAIMLTGFERADSIATLVVVALMVKAGIGLVLAANRILLEAAPPEVDPGLVGTAIADLDTVVEVHDLHVWEISSGSAALSAHVIVDADSDCHAVRRDLAHLVARRYGITHSTVQVDHAETALADEQAGPQHCAQSHGPTHRTRGQLIKASKEI